MDWYKTKNILIFVLIILNLTIFTVFWRTNTQYRIIKNQTYDNIIKILGTNNIRLDKKIIPDYPEAFTSRYIERAVSDNAPFIIKLLDGSYTHDTKNNIYKSDGKTFSVQKDTFDYSNTSPDNPPKEMTEKYIDDYCIKKMKLMGLDYKLYSFDGLNYNGDKLKAIFTPVIGDYKFFDSYISFEICDKGITSISGKNLILSKTASGISSPVYDLSNVLLDLCSNSSLNKSQINKIVSISLGYYVGNVEDIYSNVLAIPVWQFAFESGTILYYDARNGKFLP